MPTTITHSLTSSTFGDFLDELEVTFNTEVSERRGTNGDIKKVEDFNITNEFSAKGGGNPTLAVGVATLTITDLTGGVKMVSSRSQRGKNVDFDEFDGKGKHYPNAS